MGMCLARDMLAEGVLDGFVIMGQRLVSSWLVGVDPRPVCSMIAREHVHERKQLGTFPVNLLGCRGPRAFNDVLISRSGIRQLGFTIL